MSRIIHFPVKRRWVICLLVLTMLVPAIIVAGCGAKQAEPQYRDSAPHQSGFVNVTPDIRLNYLDFGGSGLTLLFVTGLGDNAHVYDDFAPRFTDSFHVLALTRRGFGESSQPATGYDTETLAGDIERCFEELGIDRAIIIGHSIAGAEMTRFAAEHPERVIKMVYLDAALDWALRDSLIGNATPPVPPDPTPEQLSSPAAFAACTAETLGVPEEPLGAILDSYVFNSDWSLQDAVTPPEIVNAVLAGASAQQPEYAKVTAPILALYAVPDEVFLMFPWLTPDSPQWDAANKYWAELAGVLAQERAYFVSQAPGATVVEFHDLPHFLFLARPDEVAADVRAFISIP